jgi:primosomal protein N'
MTRDDPHGAETTICPDCGSVLEPEKCSFCFDVEQRVPGTVYRITGSRACERCNGTGIANPCRACSFARLVKLGILPYPLGGEDESL